MRIGRYEIVRSLGIGGTADVYEAEHVDLGRRVALKILRCAVDDSDETLERFRREARTSGTLQHPNIADVFDVGYTDEGSPYLVMELLTGESLDAWISRGPLSIAAAIEVGVQLADALAFVHSSGILHRDVKPANVVMHRERSGRTVAKLVDFGISKPVMRGPSDRAITREGLVVGTPHYMAPEYLGGGPATQGMDTYAAGVVLYECLAGRPPFDDESMTGLVAAILRDSAPPLTQFRPECPAALVALVERAMNRNAPHRFASAAELGQELRRVAAALAIELGPQALDEARASTVLSEELRTRRGLAPTERPLATPTPRLPRRPRAGRYTWIGAAVAASVALVVATGFAMMGGPTRGVAAPSAHLATPSKAMRAATKTMLERVAVVVPAVVVAVRNPSPVAVALPDPSTVAVEVSPPAVTSSGAAQPRRVHAAPTPPRARVARVIPDVQVVAPVAPTPPIVDGEQAGRELARRALSAYAGGQFPRALALYREAVRQNPAGADAWRGLGAVSTRMGQPTEARHSFTRYLALAPNAPDAERVRAALAALPR
jgi:serine/threonine-protein kinase